MADVLEINDIDSLAGCRMLWDSLHGDTPRASFFHTFDWLETYWRHFGDRQRLRVLVVRAAGEPIGIAPFCVRRRDHALGGVRTLTWPLDDWGFSYSPIGKNQTATLLMAMRHLAVTRRDWEELDLPWIASETTDRGHTRRAMQMAGLAPRDQWYQTNSIVELDGTWGEYLAGLDRKVRHELRRNLRRTEEWGELEFVRHRPEPRRCGDGDARWDLYDQCEEISRHSWQAQSTTGNTLCDPKYRAFYRDCHAAAARLGMADIAITKLDGKPVAFSYHYHRQGRVFGLRMGFDARLPLSGLGTSHLHLLLRDSFTRGDRRLELGAGDEKFKQRLRTSTESTCRLTHTPLTAWRPQMVRAGHWLRERITAG